MNDDELFDALGEALAPPDRDAPPDRLAAFQRQVEASGAGAPGEPQHTSRRTVLVGSIAAAVGAAAGIAGTVASGAATSSDEVAAPTQPVEFSTVASGTSVTGRTIGHTWGMELLLDIGGLPAGQDYTVAYETDTGPVAAGGFRSVDVEMNCRFNAPPLREQVQGIVVTDATGVEVVRGRPA